VLLGSKTLTRMFAAFTYRDFRVQWFGACSSSIGTWTQLSAQNWMVLSLTGSAFFLGLDAVSQAELLAAMPPEERRIWLRILEPDDAAVEDGAYLCGDCYRHIDPEDRPRWKPVARLSGFIREKTGG